jgi:hypothetical protein
MKTIIFSLMVSSCLFMAGCEKDEPIVTPTECKSVWFEVEGDFTQSSQDDTYIGIASNIGGMWNLSGIHYGRNGVWCLDVRYNGTTGKYTVYLKRSGDGTIAAQGCGTFNPKLKLQSDAGVIDVTYSLKNTVQCQ